MIERDIKQFVLKALLRAGVQPIQDDTLREMVRAAYRHVAIPEPDLTQWLKELETCGLIVGNNDAVFGWNWALTLAGKPKAQQVP